MHAASATTSTHNNNKPLTRIRGHLRPKVGLHRAPKLQCLHAVAFGIELRSRNTGPGLFLSRGGTETGAERTIDDPQSPTATTKEKKTKMKEKQLTSTALSHSLAEGSILDKNGRCECWGQGGVCGNLFLSLAVAGCVCMCVCAAGVYLWPSNQHAFWHHTHTHKLLEADNRKNDTAHHALSLLDAAVVS